MWMQGLMLKFSIRKHDPQKFFPVHDPPIPNFLREHPRAVIFLDLDLLLRGRVLRLIHIDDKQMTFRHTFHQGGFYSSLKVLEIKVKDFRLKRLK